MKALNSILNEVDVKDIYGRKDVHIDQLAFDSRTVKRNTLFVAVRGTVTDGHCFIEKAVESGASVIVCEELPKLIRDEVCYVLVSDCSEALGKIASNYYDRPSEKLRLVGITGTNGKTTVATLLYKLFEGLGYRTGLISTVENFIHDNRLASTHTTPDPVALNQLLANMTDSGCEYCFMEVSSHAIVQNRIAGLRFEGGVFTNLTHDHLDFHKTFNEYLKAKKQFFDILPKGSFALVNVDDRNGVIMLQNTKAYPKTYALKSMADFKAKIMESTLNGLLLEIENSEVWFRLVGDFNAYNILAVYSTAMLLDQDATKALLVLSRLTGAEGRYDYVRSANGILGVVDYAHTPDAIGNVLRSINKLKSGTSRVITLIGCGGDRDRSKRPLMAQAACELSDKVIITSDNPRTEDPAAIIDDMMKGVSVDDRKKVLIISDRREAIKTACFIAQPADVILLAGKGHEKYQEVKGIRYPFDDKEILTEQFNQN